MLRLASAFLALGALLAPGGSVAAGEPPKPAAAPPARVIEYRDDKLTLQVKDTPITDILDEVKKQSGAEVTGEAPKVDNVTAEFDAVPLNDALIRLLGAQSFTLTYGEAGLRTIALKGGPSAAPPPRPAESATPPIADLPPPNWRALVRVFEGRQRIPVDGRLRELSQHDTVTWDWLIQMSYAYEDPNIRNQALKTALRALNDDPEVRDAMLAAMNQLSDVEMAEMVQKNCRHTSIGFMKNIARTTDNPEWKARATAILRQLRIQARRATAATGSSS